MGPRDLSCLLPARGSGRISISRLVLPGKHRPCSRGFRCGGRSDGWVSRALPQNENPHVVVHAHFSHSIQGLRLLAPSFVAADGSVLREPLRPSIGRCALAPCRPFFLPRLPFSLHPPPPPSH